MDNQLPHYLTKAILRPWESLWTDMDSFWTVFESKDAEEKPSQSQFEAGKLLRRRCCRTISESSGHPFQVSFFVQDSRDLGEHDQISLEAIQHCKDVLLSFRTEIKKPPS
jgi:hypothetical protein